MALALSGSGHYVRQWAPARAPHCHLLLDRACGPGDSSDRAGPPRVSPARVAGALPAGDRQLAAAAAALGLTATEGDLLPALPRGTVYGSCPTAPVVHHRLHPDEPAVFDIEAARRPAPAPCPPESRKWAAAWQTKGQIGRGLTARGGQADAGARRGATSWRDGDEWRPNSNAEIAPRRRPASTYRAVPRRTGATAVTMVARHLVTHDGRPKFPGHNDSPVAGLTKLAPSTALRFA